MTITNLLCQVILSLGGILFDVLPSTVPDDVTNRLLANTELPSERTLGCLTLRVKFADRSYLIRRKCGFTKMLLLDDAIGKLLPGAVAGHMANCLLADTKLKSQRTLACSTEHITLANLDYLSVRENGSSTLFSLCLPPFLDAIQPIVGGCAKEKVRWVAARWIVAAMEDVKSVWDWTKCNRPGKTVREPQLVANRCSTGHKLAVTSLGAIACPQPALISFGNAGPK